MLNPYSSGSDPTIRHIPKFGGELWFVDGGISSSGDGKTPDGAFKTIGEAITACAAGDAITIMAATYTETGIDLNKNSVEIWSEIGVIIDPASGTGFTVSANYCKILGQMLITPNAAPGLTVSGQGSYFQDVKNNGGTIGYNITGPGNEFLNCRATGVSVDAFYIAAGQQKLKECSTVGAGGATYGFRIANGSSTGLLDRCTSVNHATSGFYIDTGSASWTVLNCSSGAGDGKWRDIDDNSTWSGFIYRDTVYKQLTLDNSHAYNLFMVVGAVEILEIYGHVTTTLVGANTDVSFQLYSSTGTDAITKAVDADLGTADIGSLAIKTEDPGKVLSILLSGAPSVDKTADPKKKGAVLVADVTQDTYIRWVCGGNDDTSGAMHFHLKWRPLTDEGMITPV